MTLVSSGLLYLGTANNAGTRSIQTELGITNPVYCLSDAVAATDGNLGFCMSGFYGFTNAFTFTISGGGAAINGLQNVQEANLATLATAAGWNGSDAVIATLSAGVWLWSDSTSTPGLLVPSNIPAGSSLINNGNIIARGGDGGNDGGFALRIQSADFSVINNAGAFIAGGGGGGGFRTTNLGRGWSVGGGGGAGGGRGSNGSGAAGGAGGVIGATGSGGDEAGGTAGGGTQGGGFGGGRVLPGNTTAGTNGSGGGWGADGGSATGAAGVGGPAIISDTVWEGITGSGTTYGLNAPIQGSGVPVGGLFHHQEAKLSELGVQNGDTYTIPENFFFWSDDAAVPALTADVANVTINNNGSIIGRGGDGGSYSTVAGTAGGPALHIPVLGVTINNSSTGFIAGGGGGGGGRTTNLGRGEGNGGGGGAGGGNGGAGSASNSRATTSIPGAIGQPGISGAETGGGGNSGTSYGAGGGRVTPGAAYTPAAGGGGGWGQAGVASGSAGGAAGAAITGTTRTVNNSGTILGATS